MFPKLDRSFDVAAPAFSTDSGAAPRVSGAKRRVLFVDSDPTFAHSLQQDFETRAFDVETAGTPEEAQARVTAAQPDLVVLDLYLQGGSALGLLRTWKAQAPSLVVILVSGNASLAIVVDALKEGARRFFTKPVSAAALLDELEDRQNEHDPFLSPLIAANHQLSTTALKAKGVDRFFAISPGLLSVAGFDGYFKMLNPAWEKTLGYSIDELCARPYLELVHPDDHEKATDEALEIHGGQTVFRFKNRYRCKDGSYRWLAWSATPFPAGGLVYAAARDVTGSVRMEQGLRESNHRLKRVVESREVLLRESIVKNDTLIELARFKDEVSAMIVHDLKNPLAVIVGNYDYILEGFEGPADCMEALRDSQSAGRRMLRLLANLIDVARLEEGTLDIRASDSALAEILQPIAEQRRGMARTRKINVVLLPCPPVMVRVDSDLITRTVENILDNAFRHTPDGGTVEIEVREVGPDVEIRIGNSGRAIPVEARAIIFQKYHRENSDLGRMNVGLGLYFCRLAIEAHGGQIWVEETERLPTVFGLRLPGTAALEARRS